MNTDLRIAIVGGGPGGLTLARLLQKNGVDVRVYERDESRNVRVQGATLDLHEDSGLKALAAAGLKKALKATHRPGAHRRCIVDRSAKIYYQEEAANSSCPEIDRGQLRELLLNSLSESCVVWNHQLLSLETLPHGFRLQFKNGESAEADVVIAADGANSKVRPYITPIKAVHSGVNIVEGAVMNSAISIPEIHKLLNGGKIFALSDEKSLILSAKGDGSLVFYLGFKASGIRSIGVLSKAFALNWFKRDFVGWDEPWLQLFAKAEPKLILRPQFYMPIDQNWEAQPNLTMIGDAAHVMPPFAGEGVNMAMLDALELAESVRDLDWAKGIATFEQKMRTRAAERTRITLEQTASLHSANAIQNFIAQIS